jgi:isoquinoline 1-oxidoreductase alpha subunit
MAALKLHVNGVDHSIEADPEMPLLWALRDLLGLTGTKYGCGEALCGACTVHLDGMAVRACQTTVSAAAKQKITTIEGLSEHGDHPLQKAWCDLGVPQCGYCQPGQIMSAAALLSAKPRPTDAEIDKALGGNICRCGCYQRIREAVHVAAGQPTKGGAR